MSIMSELEIVNWDSITFQELDIILRVCGFSGSSKINEELFRSITPLCLACRYNREDLVTLLIHHGVQVDKASSFHEMSPLHFACSHSHGNLGMVRKIVEAKANLDCLDRNGHTGLHLACTQNNVPVVELLIENGANVNIADIDGETPLIRACLAQSTTLVNTLLKAGADPNLSEGWEGAPLNIAVHTQSVETLKLLIEAGADTEAGPFMSEACESGCIDVIKDLHNYGTSVNKPNIRGMPPLHTACLSEKASPLVVKLLLQWGADVHANSSNGQSALNYACTHQDIEKIKYLLDYGANPNAQGSHQLSPLLIILKGLSGKDRVRCLRLLMAAGARLDRENVHMMRSYFSASLDVEQNHEILALLDLNTYQPANLQSLCRIRIRSSLYSNMDEKVETLPLPPQVIRFLKFANILENINQSSPTELI